MFPSLPVRSRAVPPSESRVDSATLLCWKMDPKTRLATAATMAVGPWARPDRSHAELKMAVRRRRVVVERSSPHNTGDDGTRDQGAARSMRLEPDDSADEEVAQRVGASRRLLACHAQDATGIL